MGEKDHPASVTKNQWRHLAPGVYHDEARNALHIDPGELLEANGFADTPQNRDMLYQTARDMLAAMWPGVPIDEL